MTKSDDRVSHFVPS